LTSTRLYRKESVHTASIWFSAKTKDLHVRGSQGILNHHAQHNKLQKRMIVANIFDSSSLDLAIEVVPVKHLVASHA